MSVDIAIVIPWFGKNLSGGAEKHAWEIAQQLSRKGFHITVLTTCSRQFQSNWSDNYFQPGEYVEENIKVIRFSVKSQNITAFHRINSKLLSLNNQKEKLIPGIPVLNKKDESIYLNENINSPELITYLVDHQSEYHAFIFLPYLFPSTIQGISKVKDKAILLPCLHNESYAFLGAVQTAFLEAKKIVFISEGEYELALNLYSNDIKDKSIIAGAGIETDITRIRNYALPPVIDKDYILCLGRREVGKNTHMLIEAFEKYLDQTGNNLKLVLAGPGDLPVKPKSGSIIDLGLVSEDKKINLLKYCKTLINPSTNESFSRVIFEAWIAGKPVIVHSHCLATLKALEASGYAGWYMDGADSLVEVFKQLTVLPNTEFEEMGLRGQKYAMEIANWAAVSDKYMDMINNLIDEKQPTPFGNPNTPERKQQPALIGDRTIVIMAENIYSYDAVGIDVITQYRCLMNNNFNVYLFGTRNTDDSISQLLISSKKLQEKIKQTGTILVYHYSSYCTIAESIIEQATCKIAVKYHNITPAYFFTGYSKAIADITTVGRFRLQNLIKKMKFDFFMADSDFNALELTQYGVPTENIAVIEPMTRISDFNEAAINQQLAEELTNGKLNVLFVGRKAPNKGIRHLISVIIEYVQMYGKDIRLYVVGTKIPEFFKFNDEVAQIIKDFDLEDIVFIRERVSADELHTYYTYSNVFLLMSEHEGFCVPVLEAQYHNLPIIALDRGAVRRTLGENQLIFENPDYRSIASAIHIVSKNDEISSFLKENGTSNLLKHSQDKVERKFIDTISSYCQLIHREQASLNNNLV